MQGLESILRNVFLSHVVVREIHCDNNKTLIRIHLMHQNKLESNKRNKHVSHLPKYQKIKDLDTKCSNLICSDTKCSDTKCSDTKCSNLICSICQDNFTKGEYFRELPICKHIYHKKCIDKWFLTDLEMRCPMCRTSHTEENLYENSNIG